MIDPFQKDKPLDNSSLQNQLSILRLLLENLETVYGLRPEQAVLLLEQPNTPYIPISIFSTGKLTVLEAIVKFLSEKRQKKYTEIAKLLKRSPRSMWGCFKLSSKKFRFALPEDSALGYISLQEFSSELTPTESLVYHLKERNGWSLTRISDFLKKNQRTIWALYNRASKKRASA